MNTFNEQGEDLSSRLSIIMPAYNEAEAVGMTLQKLVDDPWLINAEIIVVNDGSKDKTGEIIQDFPRVNIVTHPVNKGMGEALISGIKTAKRDYVIWFDADGQHRLEDLIAVAKKMMDNNLDYCIGTRDGSSHQESSRKAGKLILKYVVQIVAGQKVPDFNSGLRGFRRDIIKKYVHFLTGGFGASTTTTLLMLERGYKGGSTPIIVQKRIGKSSVRQIRDGLRTLLLILRIFLIFKPLHFFGCIGTFLFSTGLLYGLWSAVFEGQGFPVFGAVVLLFGAQIIFLGLIMDQISAMRRERFK